MPHDDHRVIEAVLRGLPLRCRLAHLAASLLVEDGALSVEFLVEVALVMTRRLPPAQQTSIVWDLRECAEELRAQWN